LLPVDLNQAWMRQRRFLDSLRVRVPAIDGNGRSPENAQGPSAARQLSMIFSSTPISSLSEDTECASQRRDRQLEMSRTPASCFSIPGSSSRSGLRTSGSTIGRRPLLNQSARPLLRAPQSDSVNRRDSNGSAISRSIVWSPHRAVHCVTQFVSTRPFRHLRIVFRGIPSVASRDHIHR
jgi:hypothetical protein